MTGYAYFKDIARGRLSGGDAAGFLKLVSRADEPTRHVVIGVQIIGGLIVLIVRVAFGMKSAALRRRHSRACGK